MIMNHNNLHLLPFLMMKYWLSFLSLSQSEKNMESMPQSAIVEELLDVEEIQSWMTRTFPQFKTLKQSYQSEKSFTFFHHFTNPIHFYQPDGLSGTWVSCKVEEVLDISIFNHATRCMDDCKTNVWSQTINNRTLITGIAEILEVKVYGMVFLNIVGYSGQVHHLAI